MSDFERDMVVSRELEDGIQLQQPNFIEDTIVQSLSPQFNFNEGFEDDKTYNIQKEDIRNTVDAETKTIRRNNFRINDVNYSDLKSGVTPNLKTFAFEDVHTIKLDNGSRVCVRSEDCILIDLSDHSLLDGYLRVHADNPDVLESYNSFTLLNTDDGLVMRTDDDWRRYFRFGVTVVLPLLTPIAWFFGTVAKILWLTLCLLIYPFVISGMMDRRVIDVEFVEDESVILNDIDVKAQKTVTFNITETDDGIILESDSVDDVWSIQKEDGVYPAQVIELFELIGFNTIEKDSVELKIIRNYNSEIQGLKSDDGNWVIPMDQFESFVAENSSTNKSLELV